MIGTIVTAGVAMMFIGATIIGIIRGVHDFKNGIDPRTGTKIKR